MAEIKFPTDLFVREENVGDGDAFAHQDRMNAINGDGPTRIGKYKLVEIITARKRIEIV